MAHRYFGCPIHDGFIVMGGMTTACRVPHISILDVVSTASSEGYTTPAYAAISSFAIFFRFVCEATQKS